ncbi:MAG: glycosyltransferase, partial [Ferruginibacter sp.]
MTKQIQIAALVPYKIFPAKMGGQKAVALFYNYIGALLPVTIISVKNNEFPQQFNAKFIAALDNSILRYVNPFLFFRIKKILRENKATHFIIEHPYFGWLGILLQWFLPVCLVVRSHNIEAFRFKSIGKWWWKILWHYEKYTHQYAGLNFFITEEDRLFAIKEFKLEPKKCHTITYGFESLQKPSAEQINSTKITLQQKHSITVDEKILLFNGTLNYKPNQEALNIILHQLNPLLLAQKTFSYKIIICGKNLPESFAQLKDNGVANIIYAGFVEDVSIYFEGADIFINPVTTGGGIKTKLIEALGANLSCVSTASGAEGIPAEITGGKLIVVPDNNWQAFAAAIETIDIKKNT